MDVTERELILARALKVALRYAYSRSIKNDVMGRGKTEGLDPGYRKDIWTMAAGVKVAAEIGEVIE